MCQDTARTAPSRLDQRKRMLGAAPRVSQPRPIGLAGRGWLAKRALFCTQCQTERQKQKRPASASSIACNAFRAAKIHQPALAASSPSSLRSAVYGFTAYLYFIHTRRLEAREPRGLRYLKLCVHRVRCVYNTLYVCLSSFIGTGQERRIPVVKVGARRLAPHSQIYCFSEQAPTRKHSILFTRRAVT